MLTRVKRIVRNDDAKAKDMIALYRKTHPGISNTDVWLIMNADNTRRANAQLLNELKTAQGKAPSYLYYFSWRSPVHNGQMKSYPYARHSVCAVQHRSGRVDDRRHAGSLCARTHHERGVCVVAHGGIRITPTCPTGRRSTRVRIQRWCSANECKVMNDPNREERLALKAIRELDNTTTTAP